MQVNYEIIASFLYEYLVKNYENITKVCCRFNKYDDLTFVLEEFSKNLNLDIFTIFFIFYGYHETIFGGNKIENVVGVKNVKDRILEKFKKEISEEPNYEDVQILIDFKNEVIEKLKIKNSFNEESLKKSNTIIFQYINIINNLKYENENLKNMNQFNNLQVNKIHLEPITPKPQISTPPGLNIINIDSEPKLLGLPLESNESYNFFSPSIWK
jgi:hypothetical protein